MSAAVTLLESFCNCRTVLNSNASRCTHLFKLQYDRCSRTLVGMAVEVMTFLLHNSVITTKIVVH